MHPNFRKLKTKRKKILKAVEGNDNKEKKQNKGRKKKKNKQK